MIEVTERADLGRWADAWDDLVLALPVPTPFLRSWWLDATAEPTRRYLLCLDGGELVGGLALFRWHRVAGVPVLRLAGDGTLAPDHLDVLRRPGHEDAVREALAAWFAARPRVLDARGVVADSLLARIWPRSGSEVIDVAPWAPLPGSGADYLATRSRKMRQQIRGAEARLAAAGIAYERVPQARLPAALDAFERLHRERGDRAALLAELPRLRRAILAGATRDEAQVVTLGRDGDIGALAVTFRAADAVRAYQIARSTGELWRDVGFVLLARLAADACADGMRELDLLRGAEHYKSRLTSEQRVLLRVQAASGAPGRLVLAGLRTARRARRVLSRSAPSGAAELPPTSPSQR